MVLSLTRAVRLACALLITAAVLVATAVNAHADPGRFATGWTNIVPTGNAQDPLSTYHVHDVVFYKKGSGTAATGHFDSAGHFYQTGTTNGLATDWTHIIGSPYYRSTSDAGIVSDLLFYNKATGAGVFARLPERGVGSITEAPNCQKTFAFKAGWTQIAWSNNGLVFYDQQTGQLLIGSFDGGQCQFFNRHSETLPGYTNMTVTAGNHILLYNRNTGTGTTGTIDNAGYHQYRLYIGATAFSQGWTHIVGDAAGNMLFYTSSPSPDGTHAGATGVLNPDGTFVTKATPRFSGWTDLVGWPASPHIVFFYNAATGQAATGYLNGGTFTGLQNWV